MISLLVYIFPRFMTRYYIYRSSSDMDVPGKLILIRCNSKKFIKPGDMVHQVSWFNFFGKPLFVTLKVTRH